MQDDRYDSSDPQAVKKRKTKVQLEEERTLEEFRQLLQHKGNRYFLWRVLKECGMFDTMSNLDPHQMAICSGKRDIGLSIWTDIFKADPQSYWIMVEEAKERERKVNNAE